MSVLVQKVSITLVVVIPRVPNDMKRKESGFYQHLQFNYGHWHTLSPQNLAVVLLHYSGNDHLDFAMLRYVGLMLPYPFESHAGAY